MTRQEYIRTYADAAIKSATGTGLFPSVIMAQAILESGNGESTLAKAFNNHFGIKADSTWKGKKVVLSTREVYSGQSVSTDAAFRVYISPADSFRDHTLFLKDNSRYETAGVFEAASPEIQAYALKRAGYATDPNYAELLISLINTYRLKTLDADLVKNALAA